MKYTYEQLDAMSCEELTRVSREIRNQITEDEKFRQQRIQDILRLQAVREENKALYV